MNIAIPEHIEEHERVEVPDHAFAEPPEERLQQEPGDGGDHARSESPTARRRCRPGARNVAHPRLDDVEVNEHVVREAVPRVDAVEVELLERGERCGREAGLRVGDVPVAGRDLVSRLSKALPR